jgi:hypothetical protein
MNLDNIDTSREKALQASKEQADAANAAQSEKPKLLLWHQAWHKPAETTNIVAELANVYFLPLHRHKATIYISQLEIMCNIIAVRMGTMTKSLK